MPAFGAEALGAIGDQIAADLDAYSVARCERMAPSGPTAASRARTKPRNGASSRHYERTDLPHVFRTATRKSSVTAGYSRTHKNGP
jgi:hypothetical protein